MAETALAKLEDRGAEGTNPLRLRIEDALEAAGWMGLSALDRALARALVAGVTRFRTRLDAELAALTERGLPNDGFTIHALRVAAFQISRLDKIPEYAAVSTAVEHVKGVRGPKLAGFVNAVLRKYIGAWREFQTADIAERHAFQPWMVAEVARGVGDAEVETALAAMNKEAALVLRRNPRVAWEEELPSGDKLGDPTGLVGWREGAFMVQDTASQRVVELVTGERVLDLCAAPGGKAFAIAERARVVAVDPSRERLEKMREAAARLKVSGVSLLQGDGRSPPVHGTFDAVLVDAPCTSLGTIRRHPEVKWRVAADDAISASVLQFDLLEAAAPFVGAGGRLVYSVCTFTAVETDDVVREFCEEHPEFIKTVEMRLWPHRDAADAHYAAVFVRG
ncbi:MAG: methyltransferase domain-containing protein [Deltaproteobacteria bacterium]|nr:methyltransferase domain-containing protein [Deltaproteobacteria bacterium]